MTKSILIDTDIVIDFLRGNRQARSHFLMNQDSICFSSITVAEIYAGVKGSKEEADIERLFSIFPVLPVTTIIGREAGILVALYRRSHSLELPDALIAATCTTNNAELQTLNVKHYPMFKGLNPPYKKTSAIN